MELKEFQYGAAIHVGASAVSMQIFQHSSDVESVVAVDFLEQSIPFAEDIFKLGSISSTTIDTCVEAVSGFILALKEYDRVNAIQVKGVLSNIVQEAANHDVLVNRLNVAFRIDFEVLGDGQMARLVYLKALRNLSFFGSSDEESTLVVHAGPGNTRVLLSKAQKIVYYQNYRLGVHRSGHKTSESGASQSSPVERMREALSAQINSVVFDLRKQQVDSLLLIGYEIQQLSQHMKQSSPGVVSKEDFQGFVNKVQFMRRDEIVSQFGVDYATVRAVLPSLVLHLELIKHLKVKEVKVAQNYYERGLLKDYYESFLEDGRIQEETIRAAELLARRYQVELDHGRLVAKYAVTLFDFMEGFHQLDEHDRLLLEVAGIVHEIGNFLSTRAHHKHSYYLIRNSEIFGLNQLDTEIVAIVSRYHRHSIPMLSHPEYADLAKEDRMRVSKLSAFLRVADAVDASNTQRIQDLQIERNGAELILRTKNFENLSAERNSMRQKGDLFADIFGLKVHFSTS